MKIVRVIAGFVFLVTGMSFGIILHPETDPNLAVWVDRPDDTVFGRWGTNASCVAVSPNCIITTRHQGGGIDIPVEIAGCTYSIERIWNHDTADLRIAELKEADFNEYIRIYDSDQELGSRVVIGGYGVGRGELLMNYGVAYGYRYDRLQNLILRFGTNRIDGIFNGSDDMTSQIISADFDSFRRKDSTEYECIPAVYDSGGGWFILQEETWKLAGLSFAVEDHFAQGHEGDPNYLIVDEAWFSERDNPLWGRGDSFYAWRLNPFAEWINQILCLALEGDIDGNCRVDMNDFAVIAECWADDGCLSPDSSPDMDLQPDILDLAVMTKNWLEGL